METEFLTAKEVAKRMNMSTSWIYKKGQSRDHSQYPYRWNDPVCGERSGGLDKCTQGQRMPEGLGKV